MTITSITPLYGSSTKQTQITITGSNFNTLNTVTINNVTATSIRVNTLRTIITALLPIMPITVTSFYPIVVNGVPSSFNFTYYPDPTITNVTPNFGSSLGGTSVTITGTHFTNITSLFIGPNAVTDIAIYNNSTTITAKTPPKTDNNTDITLTTIATSIIVPGLFMYYDYPVITTVSPDNGSLIGGTDITITGNYLIGISSITIGGNIVSIYTINLTNTIVTLITPPTTSTGQQILAINFSANQTQPEVQITNVFTYYTPSITSVYPSQGVLAGETSITLTGLNFIDTDTINMTIGGNPATMVVVNSTTITAVTPEGTGQVSIIVTFNNDITATIPYTYSDIPVIILVNPSGGESGTSIQIIGTSFDSSTTLTIGGILLSIILDGTVIYATAPPGEGIQPLIITTNGGVASATFTYNPPLPNPPEDQFCTLPPYNATNFTSANKSVFDTLVIYAKNAPNYPWSSGTDAPQIYTTQQNNTYFNGLNQQTISIKNINNTLISNGNKGNVPYPTFKSQTERLMYLQGQTLTASRNKMIGINSLVPCSTIYQIINS